jgi:group I intron endonuclease
MSLTCKNFPKSSGIYRITNQITKDFYIGSSINLYKRVAQHISTLRSSTHTNRYLQNVWNKYREDNFSVDLLLICEPFERFRYEQKLLDTLSPKYNLVQSVVGLTGHPLTNEHKRKISIANTGRKQTPEAIARMSAAKKGKKQSPELIEKRMAPMRGRRKSQEWKDKIRSSLMGQKRTDVAKAKTFELRSPDGILTIIYNLSEFSKENGLNRVMMYRIVHGRTENYKGWILP